MEAGDGMNARRAVIRLTFEGVDISADINRNLLSLSYTDNEEDKTDDLQLSLDDREGVWLGNWLNTPSASKGAEISAVIVQKNWESTGKDRCCFANKLRKIFIQSAKKKRRLKGF